MSDGVLERVDAFVYTLGTWVYLLHSSGVGASDDEARALCDAIDDSSDATTGDAAGKALVTWVRSRVADASGEAVAAFAQSLYLSLIHI